MRYIDADNIKYTPAVESGPYRNEKDKVSGEFTIMFTTKDHIDKIPAADVEPVRHGHWIETMREWDLYPYFYKDITCSICGNREQNKRVYCPECGAKMDEEGD